MSIFPKILTRSRILLKIVIFHHRGHVEDENFNFSKSVGPKKWQFWAKSLILLKIVIFEHHGHVEDDKFQFNKKLWPDPGFCSKIVNCDHYEHVEDENVHFFQKFWPTRGFCSKLSFLTTMDMSRMKISIYSKILAQSRILPQHCHFLPLWTYWRWKF